MSARSRPTAECRTRSSKGKIKQGKSPFRVAPGRQWLYITGRQAGLSGAPVFPARFVQGNIVVQIGLEGLAGRVRKGAFSMAALRTRISILFVIFVVAALAAAVGYQLASSTAPPTFDRSESSSIDLLDHKVPKSCYGQPPKASSPDKNKHCPGGGKD